MRRRLIWLQLLIGWLPIGALFTLLIASVHRDVTVHTAALLALRTLVTAASLGFAVQWFTERVPWPVPFRLWFAGVHLVTSVAYALAWLALNSLVESALHGAIVLTVGPGVAAFIVVGMWLYVMVAGVSYATIASTRAATAEANAARAQLAALRSQLNPHFLFNALHTVVHLIPRDPKTTAQAAERLGGLLRETLDETQDLVTLAHECAFVERCLDIERLRFGDRLRATIDVSADAGNALVPSFALLTLVENAVRHGVEPREQPTDVSIRAVATGDHVTLTVSDNGAGGTTPPRAGDGTGLQRLRDRVSALYGGKERLDAAPSAAGGFTATLTVPRSPAE